MPHELTALEQAQARRAAGEWLLRGTAHRKYARLDWERRGFANLRPSPNFLALHIPVRLVHGALGVDSPQECAKSLAQVVEAGPIFYHRAAHHLVGSYVALLPAQLSPSWHVQGAVELNPSSSISVPAPDRYDPAPVGWWVSPLTTPGQLCVPEWIEQLVKVGRDAEASWGGGDV